MANSCCEFLVWRRIDRSELQDLVFALGCIMSDDEVRVAPRQASLQTTHRRCTRRAPSFECRWRKPFKSWM